MGARIKIIDIIKFICALLVVAIHWPPFNNSVLKFLISDVLASLAVPFFFFLSGYFGKKISVSIKVKKFVCMYMIAAIPYLCLYRCWNWEISSWLNKIFISGLHYHLWYVIVMIYVIIISELMRDYIRDNIVLGIVIGLNMVGVLLYTYIGIIDVFLIRVFSIGLPCYVVGQFYDNKISRIRSNKDLLYLIFSIGFMLEVLFLHYCEPVHGYTVMFSTLPIIIVIFSNIKHINVIFNTKWFGKMSLYVYILHPLYIQLYGNLSYKYGIQIGNGKSYVIIIIMSLISGTIIEMINSKMKRLKGYE